MPLCFRSPPPILGYLEGIPHYFVHFREVKSIHLQSKLGCVHLKDHSCSFYNVIYCSKWPNDLFLDDIAVKPVSNPENERRNHQRNSRHIWWSNRTIRRENPTAALLESNVRRTNRREDPRQCETKAGVFRAVGLAMRMCCNLHKDN